MEAATRIRRFDGLEQFMHVFLILTFMTLAVTGAARMYMTTDWGRELLWLLGGYAQAATIHIWAGWLLTGGFVVHVILALAHMDWKHPLSLVGPDSLVPVWRDFKELGRRILWFFGLGKSPRFERWTYWEKFDYWAVFWGIPILFVSGFMLIYPIETSWVLPGWTLNVAALVHRAEAILAVSYIVVFHLLIGHFRRRTFPLNDTMFSGSVPLPALRDEKPDWVNRLEREGRLGRLTASSPAIWYKTLYYLFAYAVIALGLYLLINGSTIAALFGCIRSLLIACLGRYGSLYPSHLIFQRLGCVDLRAGQVEDAPL